MSLATLPTEILLRITSLLELQDVARLRQSCQRLCTITRDKSIWLLLLEKQRQHYPIPLHNYPASDCGTSAALGNISAWDIEHAVTSGHRIAKLWSRPRTKPPVKAQPKMGDMLIALEMLLDRWLLVVYAEGVMYLWDTLPGSGAPSTHTNAKPRAKACAVLIEKEERKGAIWSSAAAKVTEDGRRAIIALNTKPAPCFCILYEVALRRDASFELLRTVPLSTPETIRTMSFLHNVLVLSRGSSLNLVDISQQPQRNLMIVSPHSEDLEDMWNGTIDACLHDQYIFTFKTRTIEVHNIKSLLNVSTTSEFAAAPIAKHHFPNTTFREIRFSTPATSHDLARTSFQVFAYDVLQGLFHYSVLLHSHPDSPEIPPFLTVTLMNIYPLATHVTSYFTSGLIPSPELLTPSPTPILPHKEVARTLRPPVNLSSRGFISAYAFGSQAKRAVWIERIRGSTVREVQVWSDSGPVDPGGPDSLADIPPQDIEKIVVYEISSPDLRGDFLAPSRPVTVDLNGWLPEDIIRCTLSESTGLIVLGNRAGDIFLLDADA